jgi:hypothetical protein
MASGGRPVDRREDAVEDRVCQPGSPVSGCGDVVGQGRG